ncbi:hypothetical protein [Fibrobacter sp.]
MENESQKKTYMPPKIEIVELAHQANLMQCSDASEPGCDGFNGVTG